ncbi:MAG TPA: leucyl aminopeptidase [Actinomycetota bacterium]|nr:leucyl aminopeptidase [Actinomycetota bacterium]
MPSRPQISPSHERPADVACDALVVGATAGNGGADLAGGAAAEVDTALDGALSEHLRDLQFKGKAGDVALVPTLGRLPAKTIAVAGLGPPGNAGPAEVRRAAGAAGRRLLDSPTIALALHDPVDHPRAARAALEGVLLGSYKFTEFKSDPKPPRIQSILVFGAAEEQLERGATAAEATMLARDLINTPASALTPDALARRAREVADVAGLECTVWDEDELRKRGFGGVLGVAQGSAQPPRFIQLHHKPANATAKIVLVGKGITYDSGGLSLKDPKSMETMKTDMSGAAAVIAAMGAIGRIGPAVEVLGLVPTTENMPGGAAIKPGDVITHYGGKTVEVLNTDAEGRLVLADALAFASEQQPQAIVDVATLTGAIMVALGTRATGLFCNDDDMAQRLTQVGTEEGERLWRMPLFEDYAGDIESDVADLKNISGARWGGAIVAAVFLQQFVGKGIAWAHLDIAGAARSDGGTGEITKGGTGTAARTLVSWVEGFGR